MALALLTQWSQVQVLVLPRILSFSEHSIGIYDDVAEIYRQQNAAYGGVSIKSKEDSLKITLTESIFHIDRRLVMQIDQILTPNRLIKNLVLISTVCKVLNKFLPD